MVHLARKHDGQSVVRAEAIAESEAIPPSFLAQILHELKRMGLVTSRRGKTGGWRLTKAPGEISLLMVVEALEPESLESSAESRGESGSAVSDLWEEVRESTRVILAQSNLETLASSAGPMFYI